MPASLLLFLLAPASDPHVDIIAAVKEQLKDPESARFRGLKPMGEGGGYCGWVNARNSYGGYAGYAVFYVNSKREVAILSPELSEPDLCK